MLFRLLIFAIAGIVIYRIAKSLLGVPQSRYSGAGAPPERVDDVMVKDPVCGAYFAQRKGVALTVSDNVLHFCSAECRDSYLEQHSDDQGL